MTRLWYVVYTKPRNERKVAERLNAKSFEVYCPLVKTLRQWSDRKKSVNIPMFTSYVFVRLSEPDRQIVVQDPGVLNFIYWQGSPAVVRETEIETIKRIETDGLDIEVSGSRLQTGERLEIKEGLFKGLDGEVRRIDKGKISVWIESIKSQVIFDYQVQ